MNRTGLILEDLWHRKILNAYWIVTLMFFAAEVVLLLLGCIPSVTAGGGAGGLAASGHPGRLHPAAHAGGTDLAAIRT
ncbi:hypothetical protein [Paenibacillus sp. AR247]|uniref:hypothetical protein n=1 Tax=Paenibacillus sp. AR247 TaxID=1631599 RepID=UPI0015E34D0A|nr:hypothetical protein [Paenibacillus sp. AR247]